MPLCIELRFVIGRNFFQKLFINKLNRVGVLIVAKYGKKGYCVNTNRREYPFFINVNGLKIETVIIDPHYEEKHSSVINDELILKLVKTLDGEYYDFVDKKSSFKFFVKDEIELDNKFYRLIWLLEENQLYVGVINAFRSSK